MTKKLVVSIGEKIRALRQEGKLSIQKLADLSGVSPAGIYKIEINEMTPSITTLMKIAGALGKRVSYFIEENEEVKNVEFVPSGGRRTAYNKVSKIKVENIAARLEDCKMYSGIMTIKKGGGTGSEPVAHIGEELIFCLQGELEVNVGKNNYRLTEGDSLHLKSNIPHHWHNPGKEDARILYVLTPPSFSPEVDVNY